MQIALQLLFQEVPVWNAEKFLSALRNSDPSLTNSRIQISRQPVIKPLQAWAVRWSPHGVGLVICNDPMPGQLTEECVGPAHYSRDLKASARAHRSHIGLTYDGHEPSPLEQYVALATVAAAMSVFEPLVIANQNAHTSVPASLLSPKSTRGNIIEFVRGLPIHILFAGLVKYEVEGVKGVWMRTYGNNILGIPDLAVLARGHQEGEASLGLFDGISRYLVKGSRKVAIGEILEVGGEVYKTRSPLHEEYFLESPAGMLVLVPQ